MFPIYITRIRGLAIGNYQADVGSTGRVRRSDRTMSLVAVEDVDVAVLPAWTNAPLPNTESAYDTLQKQVGMSSVF